MVAWRVPPTGVIQEPGRACRLSPRGEYSRTKQRRSGGRTARSQSTCVVPVKPANRDLREPVEGRRVSEHGTIGGKGEWEL